MRVLLVNPTQENIYGRGIRPPYPPLGLLYIASSLTEARCEVEVLDWDCDLASATLFRHQVRDYRPDVVGITSTTPQICSALSIARMVKETTGAWVVLGGAHASALPEDVISNKFVDFVIVGEGEGTVKELVVGITRGSFEGIPGLWYKQNGEARKPRPRDLNEELEALPFPARHLLRNRGRYSPPEALSSRWVSLITSRGCQYSCTFCATPRIFGRRERRRSVENVVEEIRDAVRRFGAREVHIADDCFTSEREWVLDFCLALRKLEQKLRLYLMNGLRADQVDYELLRTLKEVGLRNVGFGVESGSETVLRRTRKGLSLARVRESFRAARSLGLSTWGFFILGLPGETPETALETIELAITLDPDYAKFFFLVPYPGTAVWDELSANGLISDYQYENYGLYSRPVFHLPTMNEEEMQRLLYRAYRKFYRRPEKVLRHLLTAGSLTGMRLKLKGALFLRRFLFTP